MNDPQRTGWSYHDAFGWLFIGLDLDLGVVDETRTVVLRVPPSLVVLFALDRP